MIFDRNPTAGTAGSVIVKIGLGARSLGLMLTKAATKAC